MAVVISVVGKFNDKDLKKAQEALDKLKKEAQLAASPLARVGKTFEDAGKKMKKTGEKFTKNLTVPIAGIAAAAGYAYKQVDDGLDTVAAKSGATGAELAKLEDSFKRVATSATQDMATVGDVVGTLAGRLDLTGQPLEDLAGKILTLSRVTNTDAATATDAVAKAVQGLGLSTAQTTPFLDQLLVASQKSGIAVDTLATQVAATAPRFQTMGIDTQDQIALLAAFARAGLPATQMLSGLNTATVNLAKKGVKDIPGALAKVITQIKAAGSESKATQIAVETFGSRAGISLGTAIRNGTLNLNDLTTALGDSQGALQKTADATMGPDEKLAQLKNQFTLAGASLADGMIPLLERLTPILSSVAGWFEKLSPGVQTAIGVTLGFAAALGPIMSIGGNIATAISKLIGLFVTQTAATTTATGAQVGLNTAMTANPIGIVVVAIGALVAGLVLAYKKVDWFRNAVDSVGRVLKTVFVGAFQLAQKVVGGVVSFISEHWRGMLQVLLTISGPIGAIIALVWKFHDQIGSAIGKVVEFFKSIPDKIRNIPETLGNIGKAMVEGLWNGISSMGGWLWNKIKEWAGSQIPDWMKKVLGINSPSKVTEAIGKNVAKGMAVGIDKGGKDTKKAGTKLSRSVIAAAEKQMKDAKGLFDGLKSAANDALDGIKDRAREVIDYAKQIADSMRSFGSVAGFDATNPIQFTAENVTASMSARLSKVRKFGDQLKELAKLGLNNSSLQEIIAAGPDTGSMIAGALLKDGQAAINEVNSLERQLNNVAASIGDIGATSQFGTSVSGAQAIIESSVVIEAGAVVVQVGAGVSAADAKDIRDAVDKAVRDAINEVGDKAVTEAKKTLSQGLTRTASQIQKSKKSTRRGR